MPASFSTHVNNLPGIFNSIECKNCMEREKINSECRFFKLENHELNYKWWEGNEKCQRPIEGLIRKFPSIYQFCNGD